MEKKFDLVKFKPGLTLEIEILPLAGTVARYEDSISAPHRTDFYQIFWIQEGNACYLIDFEPVDLKPNSFLFINRSRIKALDRKSKHDGKILLFTEHFFAKSSDDTKYLHASILFNDLLEVSVLDGDVSTDLQTYFLAIERELDEEMDVYQYRVLHNLLHNLLLAAERQRKRQGLHEISKGADLDYTLVFKDLLDAQFKTVKSVGDYALKMNISGKRLTLATANAIGRTPKNMIQEKVMLEAKRLIIHTHLSIKEIGYDLGFEEPTNFIKYFRKSTGKTPIEFKQHYPNN